MNTKSPIMERYSLPAFLILTPLISLAIALFLPLPTVAIALLLILIPATLAILLAALAEGRKGVAELLKKLFQWRVGLKWYVIALAMPVGIILASSVLAFLLGWIPNIQIHVPTPAQLISNFVLILLVAILEEFGWRGYALLRLLARRSPLSSALLIGIAWGILHIGIGLLDSRPWLPTFLAPLGLSIVLTWLFIHTRGSLAIAMLFHFMMDFSPQFLLYGLTTVQSIWSQAIVILAFAFILIVIFGPNLQRRFVEKPTIVDKAFSLGRD